MPDAPRRDVSGWEVSEVETVGREQKVWLQEPVGDATSRERRWLFKPVIVPENGRRQGEDWVEKAVAGLARLINVPCADVELAVRDGVEGSISRNVAPDGWSLELGSLVMARLDPEYCEGRLNPPGRPGHSPGRIAEALGDCGAPPGSSGSSAWATFTSYLVLDAWVANQDRHDQNWAVLAHESGVAGLRLAPSFDHASSLGFSLRDEFRARVISEGRVEQWARRGRAQRFAHDPQQPANIATLVQLAHQSIALLDPDCRLDPLDALARVDQADVEAVIEPLRLSDPSATFVLELLAINRRRLLHDR